MADVTQGNIETLASKIAGLELTEGEVAALEAVMNATGDDEVAGFGRQPAGVVIDFTGAGLKIDASKLGGKMSSALSTRGIVITGDLAG